jgi:hypothetical protein
MPLPVHFWWVTKRLITGRIYPPKGWPENSSSALEMPQIFDPKISKLHKADRRQQETFITSGREPRFRISSNRLRYKSKCRLPSGVARGYPNCHTRRDYTLPEQHSRRLTDIEFCPGRVMAFLLTIDSQQRIHERLAIAATTTPPMPYRILKLAEARW